MNVDAIRAYCLSFPEATEKLQWGDALCFKVRAKMSPCWDWTRCG